MTNNMTLKLHTMFPLIKVATSVLPVPDEHSIHNGCSVFYLRENLSEFYEIITSKGFHGIFHSRQRLVTLNGDVVSKNLSYQVVEIACPPRPQWFNPFTKYMSVPRMVIRSLSSFTIPITNDWRASLFVAWITRKRFHTVFPDALQAVAWSCGYHFRVISKKGCARSYFLSRSTPKYDDVASVRYAGTVKGTEISIRQLSNFFEYKSFKLLLR